MLIHSEKIRAEFDLPEGATVDALFAALKLTTHDALDGLLTSDESKDAALQSFGLRDSYQLFIFSQLSAPQQRFCTFNFTSQIKPVLVALVSDESTEALPTNAENLISWLLVDPSHSLHNDWNVSESGNFSNWRTHLKNKAVIAAPAGIEPEAIRLIAALLGLSHTDIEESSVLTGIFQNISNANIGPGGQTTGLVQAKLLREAWNSRHPKWRCLSLYRILENAYLSNIKNQLLRAFDEDAKKAVADATNKLSSELMQLVALAEEANLTAEFLAFNAEYETLLTAQNRFITKLDKGAENEGMYKSPDTYKKAVLRFYKLRCSIAHAGTSSVIYEQFADADSAAATLAPSIEAIALKSLRVTS